MLLRYELQNNNEKSTKNIYLPLCGIEHFIDSHFPHLHK